MLKVGIVLPTMPEGRPANLPRLAAELEQLGFESLWVADVQTGDLPSLEAVTTLAAVAGATRRVGLGFGTLALPIRPVPWLATQVATLQHLSGNRVLLGVGSGGFPHSPFWKALGVPAGERGHRTDEALRLLPRLLAGRPTTVDGVDLTIGPPAPMPPVLIGGNSDRALRRTAEHGDGWFPSLISPRALASRVTKLADGKSVTVGGHLFMGDEEARRAFVRSLIEVHGLPPAEAEAVPMPGDSKAAIAEHFAAYEAAGAERVSTGPSAEGETEFLRQCEVIAEATR